MKKKKKRRKVRGKILKRIIRSRKKTPTSPETSQRGNRKNYLFEE